MHGIITIFLKETRDILRDRRSIVAMVLVPIFFYPLVSMGLGSLITSQVEKTRADRHPVAVLAADTQSPLINSLTHQDKIQVIASDSLGRLLHVLRDQNPALDSRVVEQLSEGSFEAVPDSLRQAVYYGLISNEWVRAVVEIPAARSVSATGEHIPDVHLYTDLEDLKSEVTVDHLEWWLEDVRDSMVSLALADLGVDRSVLAPIDWTSNNVAPEQKKSGKMLALFLPYFLIILTMSGGMYPALDITAGEKERQTLESLLMAPVSRSDIAIGKFLTVCLAGLVSMILATTSMTLFSQFGSIGFSSEGGDVPFSLTPDTVVWIALLMIPTAVLFASMLVAVSISARSFKEGQSYVTPLLLLVIVPAMITFIPGINLTWPLAIVPVINLCLAMKAVLLGTYQFPLILAVFASTAVYGGFMIFVTTRIFERESVLFRT